MKLFMSHNHADKPVVRQLSSQLQLAGADVWLDEWTLRPGDSIPLKINEGLGSMDSIVICWSANAAASRWVQTEFASGLTKSLADESIRVVPVRLDSEPLPELINHLYYIDLTDGDTAKAVRMIMGFDSDRQRLMAMQETLVESGVEILVLPDGEFYLCCPSCGASVDKLRGHSSTDERHDETYYGVECTACGR